MSEPRTIEMHRVTLRAYAEKLERMAAMQAMIVEELEARNQDLQTGGDTHKMTLYQAAAIARSVDDDMLNLEEALREYLEEGEDA